MPDLYIDPEKGGLFTEGGLRLTTEAESYSQKVLMALSLNLGEFFTHINYGLPWIKNPELSVGENLRYFLGESFPNSSEFISAELDRYLMKFPFIKSLNSDYTFKEVDREFSYNVTIHTVSGLSIKIPQYITTL